MLLARNNRMVPDGVRNESQRGGSRGA
ncbi:MAG: hypothetical protein QOG07_282, partial [Pseudonocardiales bacterium]|nr:hypothetical protein [Pseudonocardiales bacterium]